MLSPHSKNSPPYRPPPLVGMTPKTNAPISISDFVNPHVCSRWAKLRDAYPRGLVFPLQFVRGRVVPAASGSQNTGRHQPSSPHPVDPVFQRSESSYRRPLRASLSASSDLDRG